MFLVKARAIIFFFVCVFSTAYGCVVTDDQGVKIALKKSAKRIISLAPDITESLFAIGAGKNIIGAVGGDYPSAARSILSVGSYTGLDLERIILLHPDLIITWKHSFQRQLAILKKLGIPVYTTDPKRLEDIPHHMMNMGCLTGNEKNAKRQADDFFKELAALKARFQQQKPITVFYQIGSYSLITINQDSWINQVITLCGGQNVFAHATLAAPEISMEALITANPEVIITDAMEGQHKTTPVFNDLPAVRRHLLFHVHPDLLERAGPRLLTGARQVCEALQAARKTLNMTKNEQIQ